MGMYFYAPGLAKKSDYGNMMQENIFNIWKGKMMSKFEKLIQGKETARHVINATQRAQCLEKIMQQLGKIIIKFNFLEKKIT